MYVHMIWIYTVQVPNNEPKTGTYENEVKNARHVRCFWPMRNLKSRLIWDWTAVIHTISASSSSLYVLNGKTPRTCRRRSVHYYETSYDTCRGTNVWPLIGSKFAKNSWKLDKADKTSCIWPFQAKDRYDVRLANRRASGVWFVLGFRMYLFWHQSDQVHLFLAKMHIYIYIYISGYIPRIEGEARGDKNVLRS